MSKEVNPNVKISKELSEAAHNGTAITKGPLMNALSLAYNEITGKVLQPGCAGCLSTGLQIVRNYLKMYPQRSTPSKQTKVKRVSVEVMPELVETGETLKEYEASIDRVQGFNKAIKMTFPDQRPDDQLKLRELRLKYPHIKARSVEGFLLDLAIWRKIND